MFSTIKQVPQAQVHHGKGIIVSLQKVTLRDFNMNTNVILQRRFSFFNVFFFLCRGPSEPKFHSPTLKGRPCFMALLPNITCLQWWDMIRDKARAHWNKSDSPPSLRRLLSAKWKRWGLQFSNWEQSQLNERSVSLFLHERWEKLNLNRFYGYQRRSESLRCPHYIYKFYKSCLHDKLITLSLTAAHTRAVKVWDYEVMVHKGLGSDKVWVCGSESGDFRSTKKQLFSLTMKLPRAQKKEIWDQT